MFRSLLLLFFMLYGFGASAQEIRLDGKTQVWQRLTLTLEGPDTRELATDNPFLNYRLNVTFRHKHFAYTVPGFYAADGQAAESSADAGNQWQVHFTPDRPGEWSYEVSFRKGEQVNISLDKFAGEPIASDGQSGTFTVLPADTDAGGFRQKGRLEYVGERYLQHAGNGQYFIKGGAGSPENLLAYEDFDGTFSNKNGNLHEYAIHEKHWQTDNPSWQNGKGKSIIGGMNYLASKGMNTIYFLVMNVAGDGDDVWPWTHPDSTLRYDISKLAQWEILFDHCDDVGLHLNMFMQETENDTLFNDGELGIERKLLYRELVARFGHHLGLTWNLGEENNNSTEQLRAFAKYIHAFDPYHHPIVVHNHVHLIPETYDPLLGFAPITGTSFQIANPLDAHLRTLQYVDASKVTGHPWVVPVDENGHYSVGVTPDGEDNNHAMIRHRVLWGNLMAGGAGVEWYFGYKNPHADLNLEDWTSRDQMWDYTRHALDFFQQYLPFWEMYHHDGLTWEADDYVFAKPGEVYVVYLPEGRNPILEMKDYPYRFSVSWYNPRTGGDLQEGSLSTVMGGTPTIDLGNPPEGGAGDWVVLVRRVED